MGTLIQLALMAGTSAGVAGLRRAALRIAWITAGAIGAGILLTVGIVFFGFAVYGLLAPQLGSPGAAAAVGVGMLFAAAIVWALGRRSPSRTRVTEDDTGPVAAVPPGLEAIGGALRRNTVPLLLAAFVAGMIMNRRR